MREENIHIVRKN